MDLLLPVVIIFLALVVVVLLFRRSVLVFDYERGLLYRNGKFVKILEPGQHWLLGLGMSMQKVDVRSRFVTLQGQEVLSSDNITIKLSLVANYQITDPHLAVSVTANYQEALYLLLQLQARDLIGSYPIDDLLSKRKEIAETLLEATREQAERIGLKLIMVSVKDIMFPGELKNLFAQVVNARKEGLAALERARGETAALRSLANAAKLLEDNPSLMQLRMLESLSSGSGHMIVLAPSNDQLVIKKGKDLTP